MAWSPKFRLSVDADLLADSATEGNGVKSGSGGYSASRLGERRAADPGRHADSGTTQLAAVDTAQAANRLALWREPRRRTLGDRADYLLRRFLVLSDVLALALAWSLAALIVSQWLGRSIDEQGLALAFLLLVPVWVLIAFFSGLYHESDFRIDVSFVDEIGRIVIASTAWCWLYVLLGALVVSGGTGLLDPAVMWLAVMPLLLVGRAIVRRVAERRSWYHHAVAVVGDCRRGRVGYRSHRTPSGMGTGRGGSSQGRTPVRCARGPARERSSGTSSGKPGRDRRRSRPKGHWYTCLTGR